MVKRFFFLHLKSGTNGSGVSPLASESPFPLFILSNIPEEEQRKKLHSWIFGYVRGYLAVTSWMWNSKLARGASRVGWGKGK